MKKLYKRPYRNNQQKHVQRYCKLNNLVYTDLQIYDNYVTFIGYSNLPYEQLVNNLVAEKYTIQDELAIQRKAYNGLTDEFYLYNAYVEDCKERARTFIKERESVINDR